MEVRDAWKALPHVERHQQVGAQVTRGIVEDTALWNSSEDVLGKANRFKQPSIDSLLNPFQVLSRIVDWAGIGRG